VWLFGAVRRAAEAMGVEAGEGCGIRWNLTTRFREWFSYGLVNSAIEDISYAMINQSPTCP
jgi:hypothetical protein